MTDTDFGLLAEFRALDAELATLVAPPGIDTARGVARRRRMVRRTALVFAAAIPLVAVVLVAVGWHHPAQRSGAAAPPQLGPALDRRQIGYCPPPAAAAPDDAVTADELCNGTIVLPRWTGQWPEWYAGCPSGPVTFRNGAFDPDGPPPARMTPGSADETSYYLNADMLVTVGEPTTQLYDRTMPVAYTSALADGEMDTVVQVNCELKYEAPSASMVLVLRHSRGGSIQTVGMVVAGQGPSIKCLYGLATSGDEVRVLVGDACDSGDHRTAELQWRSYRLVDGAFVQSGGPTSFAVNPANVGYILAAPDVVLAPHGDRLAGTLSATVTSQRDNLPAFDVEIALPLAVTLGALPAGCRLSDEPAPSWVQVECASKALVGVGTARTFRLPLSAPAGGSASHGRAWIRWADPALQAGLVGSQQQAGFEINHSR